MSPYKNTVGLCLYEYIYFIYLREILVNARLNKLLVGSIYLFLPKLLLYSYYYRKITSKRDNQWIS